MASHGKKGNRSCRIGCLAILIWICLAGCGKKAKIEPGVALQEVLVRYPTKGLIVSAFAGCEDGTLFVVGAPMGEDRRVYQYDATGTEIREFEVPDMMNALAVNETGEILYYEGFDYDTGGIFLAAVVPESGETKRLCDLRDRLQSVSQMAYIDDVIYLLGKDEEYQRNCLLSYSLSTQELREIRESSPRRMAVSDVGTLVICVDMPEGGYALFEYDPKKGENTMLCTMETLKFDFFAVADGGRSVIYDYNMNSRGLVLSDCENLDVEAELYPDGITMGQGVSCVNGRIFCPSMYNGFVSFPLSSVQRKNREIRFITEEFGILESPYGCGYAMTRQEFSEDKLVLKILAHDEDYDLCLADTANGNSDNLRGNGVFYPLNDVPGIQEYLDRCYPYVREAATDENGNIWMLPIEVDVPFVMICPQIMEKYGMKLREDMTWEDFYQELAGASDAAKSMVNMPTPMLVDIFIRQYFSRYDTVDTELFRSTVDAVLRIARTESGSMAAIESFLCNGIRTWRSYILMRKFMGEAGGYVIGMPKIVRGEKHAATCRFLAVNPDSSRKKETLSYLAALIEYQMHREDVPYFSDWNGKDEWGESLRTVYADAEILFDIDTDIYSGIYDLIDGELSLEAFIAETDRKLRMYWRE